MKSKFSALKFFLPIALFSLLLLKYSYVNAQCSADAGSDVSVVIGYPPMSCANLTATATGTPPFSYLWSTGDTTQTINVCPTTDTDYWVTIMDASACSSSDTVTVTVIDVRCGNDSNKVLVCHIPPGDPLNAHTICVSPNAIPAHLAHGDVLGECLATPSPPCSVDLGGDGTFCSSDNIQLDAGAGFISYLWSDSSTAQTLTVTASGTYWVQATDSSLCIATDTVTITVNPSPLANAGNDTTVVEPDCASLFGMATGGTPPYTYMWSTSDTTSDIVFCDTAGVFSLVFMVTDANGCSSTDTVAVTITTSAPPCSIDLGNDTSFCSGEQSIELDAGPGYISYLWSDSSTAQTFTVTATGMYWVQVTDSSNCVATDSINVTVYPSPAVNAGSDTSVVEPDCASLFGVVTGGTPPYTYFWSTGDTTQDITFCNSSGTYTLIFMVTDSNGCSSADSVVVTVMPQIIINIDPNPNNGRTATVTFVVPKSGVAAVELFDMNGTRIAVLFRDYVQENINYRVDFSSENLPVGMYVVRLSDRNGVMANTKMGLIR